MCISYGLALSLKTYVWLIFDSMFVSSKAFKSLKVQFTLRLTMRLTRNSHLFVTIMLGSQNSTTKYIIITLLNALLKTTQMVHRASFRV